MEPIPAAIISPAYFFHVVNTILLLLVLVRFTNRLWPSALVAALFALHPLHLESVAGLRNGRMS